MLDTLRSIATWCLLALAAWIALFNLYTLVVHPLRQRSQRRRGAELQNVSPIPLMGTAFVFFAMLISPGSSLVTGVAIALLVIDTAGLPWLVLLLPVILFLQRRET